MEPQIRVKGEQIAELCRGHRVRRLALFGSALGKDFDPQRSDLDFLVSFLELRPDEYADTYFGLLEDLEALFQRSVDLVVDSDFQNPYFRQAVESTRTLVYAS